MTHPETPMDKLEERLLAGKTPSYVDPLARELRNPDGPAALAEITRLKGEVERLKEGLRHWRGKYIDATMDQALISKARSSGKAGSDD